MSMRDLPELPDFPKWGIWEYLGSAFFLSMIGWQIYTYGTHWAFGGRYFMPRPLVAADGLHYLDGMEIDPVSLGLIAADNYEETLVVMLFILFLFLAYVVIGWVRFARRHFRLLRRAIFLQEIEKAQAAGRWQDVQDLIDYYAKTSDPNYPLPPIS